MISSAIIRWKSTRRSSDLAGVTERFSIIDIIGSDDDSTMRAVLKHPSKGARGQFIKSSKGKLHTEVPEPYFLADPSHCVKVLAKHIFSIVNESRA